MWQISIFSNFCNTNCFTKIFYSKIIFMNYFKNENYSNYGITFINQSIPLMSWSLTLETHHHVWGLKDRQNVLSTVLFIIMRKLELKSRVKLTLYWSNQWLYILQHEINENSCTTTIQVDLSLFCMETTCLVSKHGSAFRVLMISWPIQSSYSH